ncbi:MAG: tetratricopeptide repeat protein [Planctomycetota bacterium]
MLIPMNRIERLRAQLGGPRDGALLRHSLGSALLEAGDAGEAAAQLRAAVEFDPEYSAAWKLLGKAYTATGEIDAAADAWQRGIAIAERRGGGGAGGVAARSSALAWVAFTKLPDLEGLTLPGDFQNAHQLIVVAVPTAAFGEVHQGSRTYRQAIFADWHLRTGEGPQPAAGDPWNGVCLTAIAGKVGQVNVARQRNFQTGRSELHDALVSEDAPALYLVFSLPTGANPGAVEYRGAPQFGCSMQPAPALMEALYLPVKAPGRWVDGTLNLRDAPLQMGAFGACDWVRRSRELRFLDPKQGGKTIAAGEGRAFVCFQFAARPEAIDFDRGDWHLVLTDATTLAPVAISADGGRNYQMNVLQVKGFSGGVLTTPVVVFNVPEGATPARLQFQAVTVTVPR